MGGFNQLLSAADVRCVCVFASLLKLHIYAEDFSKQIPAARSASISCEIFFLGFITGVLVVPPEALSCECVCVCVY